MNIKHSKGIIRATGVLTLNNAAVIGGIIAPPTIDIIIKEYSNNETTDGDAMRQRMGMQ